MTTMNTESSSSSAISGLTADLQNINLDVKSAASTVTFTYENDQKTKNPPESTPSISKYFTQSNKPQVPVEATNFFNDVTPNNSAEKSLKTEPAVCRIFAEAPPQQKTDPATSFFDFIGNKNGPTDLNNFQLGTKDPIDVSALMFPGTFADFFFIGEFQFENYGRNRSR